jgi:hypothetical protein
VLSTTLLSALLTVGKNTVPIVQEARMGFEAGLESEGIELLQWDSILEPSNP